MGQFSRYRLDSDHLFRTLDNWDRLMRFHVNLIGCGGTALTLMEIKESTKDVDFTVPVETEHDRLLKFLRDLGYQEKGVAGLIPMTLTSCFSFGGVIACLLRIC